MEDLIIKGGMVNYILLCLYAVTVLIVIERIAYFLYRKVKLNKFMTAFDNLLTQEKSIDDCENCQKFKRSPEYDLAKHFIDGQYQQKDQIKKQSEICLNRWISKYESSLWFLSLIGSISPMMGLLGTMMGLVQSFKGIESLGGRVDISVLAGGIWQAMLTTVAGIIVGIIALIFYRVLDHYVDKRAQDLEAFQQHLLIRFYYPS